MGTEDKPGFETGSESPTPNPAPSRDNSSTGNSTHVERQSAVSMLAGLGRLTASGSGSSKTPDEVLKILKEIGERVQKDPKALRIHSLVVEDPVLNIPAVVLYAVSGEYIYYCPLLLELLGQPLSNAIEHFHNNRSIEVDRPTTRYYDSTMRAICEAAVAYDANKLGISGKASPLSVSHVVIQRNIDLENPDKLAPFYDVASSAIVGNIKVNSGNSTSELTVDILADQSVQLVARNEINPGSTYASPTGDIVCGDFCVNLLARATQTNNKDIHNTGGEVVLASAIGFMDFAYHAPEQNHMHQMPGAAVAPMPAYDPILILTDITPLGKSVRANDDLLSQLLALASIAGTISNLRWSTIFNRSAGDNNNKTSIGAFGLEHNPFGPSVQHTPKMLNVTAGDITTKGNDSVTPFSVIQTYCNNTMIVALDIVQGGPLAWIQSLFASATQGSDAEHLIIKELDDFSNGMFSRIWDRSQGILAMPSIEVHLGNYTDAKGELRDIRSLDYLTMLEASQADHNVMIPYSKALTPGASDLITMHESRKLIQTYAPNVTFTGIATRVFFNTAFINALDKMNADCGLRIILEGLNDIAGQEARGSVFNYNNPTQIVGHGVYTTFGANTGAPAAPLNHMGMNGGLPGFHR